MTKTTKYPNELKTGDTIVLMTGGYALVDRVTFDRYNKMYDITYNITKYLRIHPGASITVLA
jgi:preprotein translocase subunit YajC